MPEPQVPVPAADLESWKVNTYQVRASRLMLRALIDPRAGSPLADADTRFPHEKVSAWSRSYLDAACEHLELWANTVAPYKFDPDQANDVLHRPYILLARAGLESSAHAAWVLGAAAIDECVERHLRLIYRDLTYNIKAWKADGEDVGKIEERQKKLVERAEDAGLPKPTTRTPGYEGLVKAAAEITGHDAARWSYLWNAASGAGHGQNWFTTEGYDIAVGEEYEPGYFRTIRVPDPQYITETMDAAATVLMWGVTRWADLAGFNGLAMFQAATREVHDAMPKISPPEQL